jgi:predicted metal-dependent RNase
MEYGSVLLTLCCVLLVWKQVHTCIAGGGKVLIPVFALGRAQVLFLT